MTLIGIAGHKQAGKSTLAGFLSRTLGIPQDSFAAPIRRAVADILGISPEVLELRKETPVEWLGGKTPREMMQTMGTEWGRTMVHHELWIRSLIHRKAGDGVIIGDVRFPNEAHAILTNGGIVLRVTRPGHQSDDRHSSEDPLPDRLVSHEIENDGPPADMFQRALSFIQGGGPLNLPGDDAE